MVSTTEIFGSPEPRNDSGVVNSTVDDETLMLRYRDGDAGAFAALYARHKGGLYRYLLRQCREPTLAEELFQDIWLSLIRSRAGYQVKARFTTYLYRLAHNRLIDHYRASRRQTTLTVGDDELIDTLPADAGWQPDIQVDNALQAGHLLAAINTLPDAQREAFLLRAEAALSLDEIAEVTDSSRETVKSRLRYAMNKLRQRLESLNEP